MGEESVRFNRIVFPLLLSATGVSNNGVVRQKVEGEDGRVGRSARLIRPASKNISYVRTGRHNCNVHPELEMHRKRADDQSFVRLSKRR